jgi:hypothetical protein
MINQQEFTENAIIYCAGAKMSLNQQLANSSEFKTHLNDLILKTKNNSYYHKIDFDKLTELTAKFTRNNVDSDGDAWDDLNSVAWYMGINCYIWENSINHIPVDFDTVFLESWNKYFGIDLDDQKNESKIYAEIINKGECLSSINGKNTFNWKNENIKFKAGKSEWLRHNFYPANGMVGEIVDSFENPIWGFKIYVLQIGNNIYVPMSEIGIKFISENEYISKSNIEKNIGLDIKTKILHQKENEFHNKINNEEINAFGFTSVEKKSIFNLLIQLMNADGKIDVAEMKYLTKIQEIFSVTTEDLEEIIKLNSITIINSIQKMNDLKKSVFKIMMIELMGSDGDSDNFEENELFLGVCVACQL